MAEQGEWREGEKDETRAFTEYLNAEMAEDPDLVGKLPMATDGQLFPVVAESVLLLKFLRKINPSLVDLRYVALQPRNPFEINGNHNLLLSGAKQVGLVVVNIGPTDLSNGTRNLILGLVWQMVRCHLLSRVNVQDHPGLSRLIDDDEDVETFVDLPPEMTLLRWINYHLENAGHTRRVFNFDEDLKDSENYIVLLQQLDPSVPTTILQETSDPIARATFVVFQAERLGCSHFLRPEDIVNGRTKLNLALIAKLFDLHPSIQLDARKEAEAQIAAIEQAQREKLEKQEHNLKEWMKSEEERFQHWMEQEEQELRKRLGDEEAAHAERMEEERRRLEKQKEELEKAQREFEKQQQLMTQQQSFNAPPSDQRMSQYGPPPPTSGSSSSFLGPYPPPNPGYPPPNRAYPPPTSTYPPPGPGFASGPSFAPPPGPGFGAPPPGPGFGAPPPGPGFGAPPPGPGFGAPPPGPAYGAPPPGPAYGAPPPGSGYGAPPPGPGYGPPPPGSNYGPPPTRGSTATLAPAPAPAPAPTPTPTPASTPTPAPQPVQKLGKRWAHGNRIFLLHLLSNKHVRVKKGEVNTTSWSGKQTNWMIERTQTHIIKLRNVAHEGHYLHVTPSHLTSGPGSSPKAELVVIKHGKGRDGSRVYSFALASSSTSNPPKAEGLMVGFNEKGDALKPGESINYAKKYFLYHVNPVK